MLLPLPYPRDPLSPRHPRRTFDLDGSMSLSYRLARAAGVNKSELDLPAELHDPGARNLDERRRTLRIARHDGEQLLAPPRHARAADGDQTLTPEEERDFMGPDVGDPTLLTVLEDLRDVRRLHETVARDHAHEVLRKPFD